MAPPRRRISMNASPQGGAGEGDSNRKRTLVISLLAFGAGAVTIGGLTGTGSSNRSETRTYRSVSQCEADKLLTPEECATNFQQARAAHESAAPAFTNRNDCEREYGAGNCAVPSSTRTSSYIPLMTAYLIGRRAGGGYQSAPMYRRPTDPANEYRLSAGFPAPLPTTSTSSGTRYSSSSSSFRSGSRIFTSGNRTSTSRSGITSSRSSTSRGGFGTSARSSGS